MGMLGIGLFVRFGQWALKLAAAGDKALSERARGIGAWRRRACPLCKARGIVVVKRELWTGIPGTLRCTTYRCRACNETLFAAYGEPVMTMAEQARWQESKEMRILMDPGIPRARARLRE